MRKIEIVSKLNKEQLRRYLFVYLTELSEFDPDIKFDKNGTPIYKWFDCYFEDKDRFPIYFKVDGVIAGFALIRELNIMQYDFAEFYVCPKFRENGNSLWFATSVANLFNGEFVFSTRHTNPRAIKFWGKFAKTFEDNSFYDDEIWRNFVIRKNKFNYNSLGLQPKYFEQVKNKEKIFEGRLNDEKRQNYKKGDILTILLEPNRTIKIDCVITDKILFKNFDEMVNSINLQQLGFKTETKEEVVSVYRKIYSKENEEKFGVAILQLEVL